MHCLCKRKNSHIYINKNLSKKTKTMLWKLTRDRNTKEKLSKTLISKIRVRIPIESILLVYCKFYKAKINVITNCTKTSFCSSQS